MRKFILSLLALCLLVLPVLADEGMWIPLLLKKYNMEDMQKAGFTLTAEDIYAINQASLKDAVVGLGRAGQPFQHFCTGEIVSEEGLVITNHHCAYAMIQAHTTLERNYLRDGFWAKTKQEELANPQITASILVRMEDVTDRVKAVIKTGMSKEEQSIAIAQVTRQLERETEQGTNLHASIKPYFNGNQYFMSVFKIYGDVRLVGAPPSAIGKFGGDTDNWAWPRHTGDFALLRIYAGEGNEPARFSEKNKPYKPDTFFKVSTRGVKEGDFTVVFGYPGTTQEYLPSFAIDQLTRVENPHKVKIRTAKLKVVDHAMESDELLRIKYAAKAASIANSWKKWQGEIKGLHRFKTADTKRALEAQFLAWVAQNGKKEYTDLVSRYRQLYREREAYILALAYATEAGTRGAEIMGLLSTVQRKFNSSRDEQELQEQLKSETDLFYKNYDPATDCRILAEMLRLYHTGGIEKEWVPPTVQLQKKYTQSPDGFGQYAVKLFKKSPFTDPRKAAQLIPKLSLEDRSRLEKDPLYQMMDDISNFILQKIQPRLNAIQDELKALDHLWMAALMEMQPDRVFYPDANSTFRVAYGKVTGYEAVDAVYYQPGTTLTGIMQKDNPDIYDYDVPQRLRDLHAAQDFGPYGKGGELPVCFIATNHTTGGNSGSPVLNAEGHLIGLNFDRAWEGVMSDYEFHPEICRNISVDIRYVLFIIDKYAGATHLIEEMELVD